MLHGRKLNKVKFKPIIHIQCHLANLEVKGLTEEKGAEGVGLFASFLGFIQVRNLALI